MTNHVEPDCADQSGGSLPTPSTEPSRMDGVTVAATDGHPGIADDGSPVNEVRDERGERGMPALNQRSRRARSRWFPALAIGVIAVIGAVWTVHGFIARHDADAKARRDSAADQPVQGRRFSNVPLAASATTPAASSVTDATASASAPIAVVATPASPHTSAAPVRSYYDAPLVMTGQSGTGSGDVSGATGTTSISSSASGVASSIRLRGTQGESTSPLAQALTPTATPRVTAGSLGDRNFILAQGAKIDCVGDTAFDSTEA